MREWNTGFTDIEGDRVSKMPNITLTWEKDPKTGVQKVTITGGNDQFVKALTHFTELLNADMERKMRKKIRSSKH